MAGLKDRYIRFDWAIKRLLRQKANFDVLDGFLTVFLNQKVKVIEILVSRYRILPNSIIWNVFFTALPKPLPNIST